jgi:ribosomal protein S7
MVKKKIKLKIIFKTNSITKYLNKQPNKKKNNTYKYYKKTKKNFTKFSIKQKLLQHVLIHGKKQTSEIILSKTLKLIQKIKKQSHINVLKLAIQNITSSFRIIKLRSKKTRNKQNKEIPTFIYDYNCRSSWGLKNLIKTIKKKKSYHSQLKQEILLNAKNEGQNINKKNELQEKIQKINFILRKHRW